VFTTTLGEAQSVAGVAALQDAMSQKESKLALCLHLAGAGWQYRKEALGDHVFGDRVFDARVKRQPTAYYVSLLREGDISQKGAPNICGNKPALYYECLLRLSSGLDKLHAHPDFLAWTHIHFKRILALGPSCLDAPLPMIEDAPVLPMLEDGPWFDDEGSGSEGPPPPPPPAPPIEMLVGPVEDVDPQFKRGFKIRRRGRHVNFDNCSHASGHRLFFVLCGQRVNLGSIGHGGGSAMNRGW